MKTNGFKSILISAVLSLCFFTATAQDKAPVNFGKVSAADFNITSPLIDSNTSAVIIADVGETTFEGNSRGWFTYIHKRRTRIKILDKKALGLATVQFQAHQNSSNYMKADNISAASYNLENAVVTETKLTAADIFDNNHSYKTFVVPGAKEGSIIEYSYTIKSDFLFNLPGWEFQSPHGPTLWSEYNVTIPGLLSYRSVFTGNNVFFIDKGEEGFERYAINQNNISVSVPTTIHRWVKKDIPEFNAEGYIYSPKNFIDQISFQLYKIYNGEEYHDVLNNWKDVAAELLESEYFGKHLDDDNNLLDKISNELLKNADGNELETARRIYYYIQNNYTCTNYNDIFLSTDLQAVVKKKSGTVGDINLLMLAMLRRKNIRAFAVLLSTRSNGRCRRDYPLIQQINYVICKITIDSTEYYLDAATRFLPFGKLSSKCYNGFTRIVSWDSTAVNFDPGAIKNSCMVTNVITNTEKNTIEGTSTHNMGFFESLNEKQNINKSTLSDYTTKIKRAYPEEVTVDSISVENLESAENDLSVKVTYQLKGFETADVVYFNPMMEEAIKKNPFYAATRLYPVEMPWTSDDIYTLNMEIPKGYTIDELPKSTRIALNENEGMFEYLVSVENNTIYLKSRVRLKKTFFISDDYQSLRDFYAFVVKKQAEQIVFKKIK